MKNLTTNKINGAAKGKKMRKAFTLIEIVFVAVIIAVLAGMIIPKVLNNARTTEYLSVAQENFKSLKSAINQMKFDNKKITSAIRTGDVYDYMPDVYELLTEQAASGAQLMQDKNNNAFKIAIEGNDDGTANVAIKLNDYDKVPQGLKNKIILKGVKQLHCDKDASIDNANDKELQLKNCTF